MVVHDVMLHRFSFSNLVTEVPEEIRLRLSLLYLLIVQLALPKFNS
jgi:hypothetical protein